MADEQFAMGTDRNSSDEVTCNESFLRLLVLVLTFEDMLVLGRLWSVCITNLLRDSVLRDILVDILWLLHHARAAFTYGEAQCRRPHFAVISYPYWLQGCGPTIRCSYNIHLCGSTLCYNGTYRS